MTTRMMGKRQVCCAEAEVSMQRMLLISLRHTTEITDDDPIHAMPTLLVECKDLA